MKSFHAKQNKWQQQLCTVCHEAWPSKTGLLNNPTEYICTRCKRDKHDVKKFSGANDMLPGSVPLHLKGLSQVEEMLIARACPIMSIYRKHGGQRGYKGHVLNLPQDIQGFLDTLPRNINDLPILFLRRNGHDNTHVDLQVRRNIVMLALQWLKLHNPYYLNITINDDALQRLPQDGIPDGLQFVDDNELEDEIHEDTEVSHNSYSLLPVQQSTMTENDAICAMLSGDDPLAWPSIINQPINEFQTPGLATQAFPTLFPYGTGDPTCPGRRHKVTLTEAFKHLIRYADETDNDFHWRFAAHPRFPYWALNMKLRHQLLSQSSVYVNRHPEDSNLTFENLRDMVGRLSAEQLIHRLHRYTANVQGSNSYWYQRYKELQTLIEQKGTPTFFFTVSSADTYWPELHKLMPNPDVPDHSQRVNAVIDNPHLTDWFFTSKLQDWISHWLYDSLGAKWHWYHYEYQARGSTHAHGCAKLYNDPGLHTLIQKCALAWAITEEHTTFSQEMLSTIHEGEEAKISVLKYADWLVTTWNNAIPDDSWCFPDPHPCAVPIHDVQDMDNDYYNLVNTVERHTKCSTAYCLCKKHRQQNLHCRFDFPKPTQAHSNITFERLHDQTIRATLTTRRNDPRVNSHNRLLLQNWRANVDIQIIVDVQVCARYIAKYIAKGEPRSRSVSAIFSQAVNTLNDNSTSRSMLRSIMICAAGERDYSAQETAHMLLSLPLVSCTYNFITISLNGERRIQSDESGELLLQQSNVDQYSTRTLHLDLSLIQFFSRYYVQNGELKTRASPVVVRTFPQYPSNPNGDNYSLYCKYQLVKHNPWSGDISNAWGGGNDSPELWISKYQAFLQTDAAREEIPHFLQEIQLAEQHLDDEEQEPEQIHHQVQDDWMVLCQLNPRFTQALQENHDPYWHASDLPQSLSQECASWITRQRHIINSNTNSEWHRQLPAVDITTLNTKQRHIYNLIESHYQSGDVRNPLHVIVSGTAGTGKSYLISAIAHLLGNHCLLTGTTGMASFNICGKTLHSTLKLPLQYNNAQDLRGSSLQQLQLTVKDKSYLVIDEMSMMGQKMFAWVDKRLRQATGRLECPFGGFSVLLFGDFGQLPPVGDRPMYALPTSNQLSTHGFHIYRLFNTVVILDQVLRQGGTNPEANRFRKLLANLHDGIVTEEDWQLLLTRDPSKVTNHNEFNDAIRLFYDKQSVAEYNIQKLQSLGVPIAKINAVHSNSTAASAKADEAGGLYPVIFLAVGASVMLTANLWPEVGLCNGAVGTVHKIVFKEDHHPPDLPIAVIVDFEKYAGPPFLSQHPCCIPIPPITFEWGITKNLSRQQLPLQTSYAITIHKSQGQTIQKAVIDIGRSEYAAGTTFVAISRLPRLSCSLIMPMPFERLKQISAGRNFLCRMEEQARLQRLSEM